MSPNFDEAIDKALQSIMELYNCDNPLEALVQYSKDYEEYEWLKMKSRGGTREEFEEYLKEEYKKCENTNMIDMNMAIVNNRVAIMIERYPKD